jgi:hypothetical protein
MDKKNPHQVDPIAEYKQGIAERAARMREERRGQGAIPDLSQADASYDPHKSPPMTLGQMGQAQQRIEGREGPGGTSSLSAETVAGLKALKSEMDKLRPEAKGEPHMDAATTPEKKGEPPASVPTAKGLSEKQVRAAMRDLDGLEFDRIAARIQQDVINNQAERSAVEARLKAENNEISLEEGLGSGVFTQSVPITDKLRVIFRSMSPHENQSLRMLLWQWVDKDPRLEGLASDLYGVMLIVATVVQIGTNKLPEHMQGPEVYRAEFNEEIFTQKFRLLSRYPSPLIHAIGVHANWFDDRVRKVFTAEALKNG